MRVRLGKLKTSDNRQGVVLQYARRVIGSPALASVPLGGFGMFRRSVRETRLSGCVLQLTGSTHLAILLAHFKFLQQNILKGPVRLCCRACLSAV